MKAPKEGGGYDYKVRPKQIAYNGKQRHNIVQKTQSKLIDSNEVS